MIKEKIRISVFVFAILLFSDCSRSGRKLRMRNNSSSESSSSRLRFNEDEGNYSSSKTVIKLKQKSGVYFLPLKVNGVTIDFILDTGASCISISEKELNKLIRNDVISEDDVIGSQDFTDANGDVTSAVTVNLKKIVIGNSIERNVEAAIISGDNVDCLLGQSWLKRFGKVSIDYDKLLLILEK
jgi:aspartyl protease family protein